ncbi:DNA polymerase III subunit gamma/tau [Endozoicomonas ascidiicola]|uniref:DNA polymerase III subunit gamma/tau n=1 Tax=Endozoicomonas ascidiicola TaxID=1698521 RepID=UPI0008331FA9|nr:DNA polymerase III subunit gamma/tau [Endozoicomonas ascidiicola]
MSYQVLARKWRPRSFQELVGQSHVLQALVNALDQNRLHHAYLFTGTRGVGKTTIARIFAKCLNCEQGVSSKPCGQCSSCKEIDDGRFVDLIEVDAASRTKVEDTRELLDNVQYAPTRGRYKVYLIDEVHMLSAHSFNALLKTLEEPPPHVKFLLATTDPQKLPITILSRCLQFSLKNMTPERIVGHLENILQQEQIPSETPALWQLARVADGSMRDALSLTDQAIAFGDGKVSEVDVGAMLGTIDQGQVLKMVTSLASANAAHILASVATLAEHSPDYLAVLDDMLSMLHRVAIAQAVPDAVDNSQGDQEQILELASVMTAEDVQLYFQIGLVGKKDLPLAPDPRSGFEMALLRMLAFRPDGAPVAPKALKIAVTTPSPTSSDDNTQSVSSDSLAEGETSDPEPEAVNLSSPEPVVESPAHDQQVVEKVAALVEVEEHSETQKPVKDNFEPPVIDDQPQEVAQQETVQQKTVQQEAAQQEAAQQKTPPSSPVDVQVPDNHAPPAMEDVPISAYEQADHYGQDESFNDAAPPEWSAETAALNSVEASYVQEQPVVSAPEIKPQASPVRAVVELPAKEHRVDFDALNEASWIQVYRGLPLGGVTGTIGSHCELAQKEQGVIALRLDAERSTLYNDTHRQRIEKALGEYFEQSITLTIDTGRIVGETPAAWRERKIAERQQEAKDSIYSDAKVQNLVEAFSATVLDDSIQPIGNVIK